MQCVASYAGISDVTVGCCWAASCGPFAVTTDLGDFCDPVLGDPIAFAQCTPVSGSDTPLTLPVYTMPSGLAYMPGQSSVPMVLA